MNRRLTPLAMRLPWRWLAAAVTVCVGGVLAIVQVQVDRLEEAFQTDARIAHRLLSQAAAEHEAVLAMLALLQPVDGGDGAVRRLPAIYPRILSIERRDPIGRWPADLTEAGLAVAEQASRIERTAAPAWPSFADGRLWLVLAAEPASYAIKLDLRAMIPAAEWPESFGEATSVRLVRNGQGFVLNESLPPGGLRQFAFSKILAVRSQPFELVVVRSIGWADLPWTAMLVWLVVAGSGFVLAFNLYRQRRARRRAEELLRLGQTGRLNALGELSAGLAHELNQPLTAVMASTQAASRLLSEEPAELGTAREAMEQAVRQARRAAQVLSRLRRLIERPGTDAAARVVDLRDAVEKTLDLLQPEFASRSIRVHVEGGDALAVIADPIGLEQIVHNLVVNAMHALEKVPASERAIVMAMREDDDHRFALLTVGDTGPGLAAEELPRVFEPFYTSRAGGLGLGLSLCETLAAGMGGRMAAGNQGSHQREGRRGRQAPGGAVFSLWLPRPVERLPHTTPPTAV